MKTLAPKSVLGIVSMVGSRMETIVPYLYNYEILGIAENLDCGSVGDVLLANLIYEFTAFNHEKKGTGGKKEGELACTSIVEEAIWSHKNVHTKFH